MKKKNIAVIITLCAALISCVISILTKSSFGRFVLYLGLSVLVFGIIGIIIQVVIERNFKIDDEEEQESDSEDEDETQIDEISIDNTEESISEDE